MAGVGCGACGFVNNVLSVENIRDQQPARGDGFFNNVLTVYFK
jgi:hypothetical protein